MGLSSRALVALLATFAAVLVPAAASARAIEYRAPAGCPSHEEVTARLEAHTPARDAQIDVRQENGAFRGEVVLGRGEQRLVRAVEARTCAAVIEALVLIVALDREEPEATHPQTEAHDEPPAREPPPASDPLPAPQPVARDRREASAPGGVRGVGGPAMGIAFSGTSLGKGAIVPGFSLFVDVVWPRPLRAAWLRPSTRLSFARSLPSTGGSFERTADASGADVRPEFLLTTGALDLCPLWLGGETLSFVACARTEVGQLRARAEGDESSTESRLWWTAGGIGRARLVLSKSSSVRPMIELSAALGAVLLRDRFHFPGHETILASPASGTLAFGIGAVLP